MPVHRTSALSIPQVAQASSRTSVSESPRNVAPGRFQLGTQLPEVVDLAVVGDHQIAAGGHHGLASARREVDDGEAAVPQRDPRIRIGPFTGVVGTARFDEPRHATGDVLQRIPGSLTTRPPGFGQSAHGQPPRRPNPSPLPLLPGGPCRPQEDLGHLIERIIRASRCSPVGMQAGAAAAPGASRP